MEPTRIKDDGTAHVHIGWGERNRGVATIIAQRVPVLPKIVVERIHPDAVIPTYASEGDSGMDVYAVEDMLLEPGETGLCASGLIFEIPKHPFHEMGYRWELQARPRSGVSYKTAIRVANAPGTIDNEYRGEVKIILTNTAQREYTPGTERDADTGAVHSVELDVGMASEALDLKNERVGFAELRNKNLLEMWGEKVPVGTVIIQKGDRVAQLVFNEVIRPLEIVEGKVNTGTDRGAGGFGSTGK
jgi:dUTP pyrophosphatase